MAAGDMGVSSRSIDVACSAAGDVNTRGINVLHGRWPAAAAAAAHSDAAATVADDDDVCCEWKAAAAVVM